MNTAHWTKFWVVNSFTRELFRGNPAGVVLDATQLSHEQMCLIARAIGTSETVFVFPSESADLELRCFTSACELPFSGHATIAALHILAEMGRYHPPTQLTIQTPSGVLKGQIALIEGQIHPMVEIPLPRFEASPIAPLDLAEALLISPEALHPTWAPRKLDLHMVVPLRQPNTVLNLYPDFRRLSRLGLEQDITSFVCFSETAQPDVHWVLRFFAPGMGINEDLVSGVAHGIVAAYLIEQGVLACSQEKEGAWVGEQGDYMEQRGRVRVVCSSSQEGPLAQIHIGGFAITAIQGQLRVL